MWLTPRSVWKKKSHITWNRYNFEKYRDVNFWSYHPALQIWRKLTRILEIWNFLSMLFYYLLRFTKSLLLFLHHTHSGICHKINNISVFFFPYKVILFDHQVRQFLFWLYMHCCHLHTKEQITYPKEVVFFSMEGGWAPGSGISWIWILDGAWGMSGNGILSTSTDSAFWRKHKTHDTN